MNGRRVELPHNTPEQVREYLEDALALVSSLDSADDLRVPVFQKAVDLLSAKQILMEQIQPGIPTMTIPRSR